MGNTPKRKEKSLTDMMLDNMALRASIELSRDSSGRPDPRIARGIAGAGGHRSWDERVKLEMMLDEERGSGSRSNTSSYTSSYSTASADSVQRSASPDVDLEVHLRMDTWRHMDSQTIPSPISAEECELSERYWAALDGAKLSR